VDDTRSEQVFNLCQLSLGVALYRAGSAGHPAVLWGGSGPGGRRVQVRTAQLPACLR